MVISGAAGETAGVRAEVVAGAGVGETAGRVAGGEDFAAVPVERDLVHESEGAAGDDVAGSDKEIVAARRGLRESEADAEFRDRLNFDALVVGFGFADARRFSLCDDADCPNMHVSVVGMLRKAMASSEFIRSGRRSRGVGEE